MDSSRDGESAVGKSKLCLELGRRTLAVRKAPPAAAATEKRSLFEQASESEDEAAADGEAAKPPVSLAQRAKDQVNEQIQAVARQSSMLAAAAGAIDPSVYAYDEVYDAMKAADRAKAQQLALDKLEKKPRYMGNFLEAKRIRDRDFELAKEKKLEREREAEGIDPQDEVFVTESYKRKKNELLKEAEEEKRKEELALRKASMGAFHQRMLDEVENQHQEALRGIESAKDGPLETTQVDTLKRQPESQLELVQKILDKGGHVDVTDDGEVADKRQLLQPGLNILKAPPQQSTKFSRLNDNSSNLDSRQVRKDDRHRRERQAMLLEQQLEESRKRSAVEKLEEKARLAQAAKVSRHDNDTLSQARARALERRKAVTATKKRTDTD